MLVCLATTLWPALAAAQRAPRWDVTPAVGITHTLNANSGNDITSAIGVSMGGRTWARVAVEAEVLRLNLGSTATSRRAYWLGGNVVAHLRNSGWRPFGVVGIGAGRVVVKPQELGGILTIPGQSNTGRALNLGGGVVIPVAKRLSVRTDARWLAIFDGADDFYHVARVTAGLVFGL